MWQRRHLEKDRAHRLLTDALRVGLLTRPLTCSRCAARDGVIQAHHGDYAKPLDVIWVCKPCHREIHYGPPKPRQPKRAPMSRTKSVAAIILGRLGGKARAKALSPARRHEIALMGGKARLARYRCETLIAGTS